MSAPSATPSAPKPAAPRSVLLADARVTIRAPIPRVFEALLDPARRTLRGAAGFGALGVALGADMRSFCKRNRRIMLAARFSQSGFLHRAQTRRQSCLHSRQVPWRNRSRTGA